MKETAYIIDPYSHGSYHEVINQGYLMMVAELYNNVVYIADKTSCDNLRTLLDKCNIKYNNIKFTEKHFYKFNLKNKSLSYLINLLTVSFWNYYYYIKTPPCADIFYNNNLFFAIIFITFFSKKDKQIYDMCHNEMELINSKSVYSVASYILSKYFRFIFCKIKLNKIFHFILLSPKMVSYFNSFIPKKNHDRMFSIDHSYIRADININEKIETINSDNRVKIGIPGAITPLRGLNTLKKILDKVNNNDICIYALSSCSENLDNKNFIQINKNNQLMPAEQYSAYVKSMDMMLLFYDVDSYKLTASGAILEAVWNEKPIIALRNMYFDYLFEKFNNLGILKEDIDGIIDVLNSIHNKGYFGNSCIMNLKNAKTNLLPQNSYMQLRTIIE